MDINATHHRSVTAGWVTGTATALRLGRSVASYEIVITNDADERVCTARVTCQLVTPAALTPRITRRLKSSWVCRGLGEHLEYVVGLRRRIHEGQP